MSVLINMEMPKSCNVCILFGEYGCPFIGAVGNALTRGERNKDCPLIPIKGVSTISKDCFNQWCPFRTNTTTNSNRCEHADKCEHANCSIGRYL